MLFSKNKKLFSLLITLLSVGLYTQAEALTFEMELVASIPNAAVPGETLSTQIMLGTEERATDRFDTAWDVVAIQSGMIEIFIDHPEYDRATQALWRDTRASSGLPKEWDLRVITALSGIPVTLDWSAVDLSGFPSTLRIRLVDLDSDDQELDMRVVSTYTYLHTDHAAAHHFRIVLDEPPPAVPPSDPINPTGDESLAGTPPQVSSPSAAGILSDLLPAGLLRKDYTARLEAQGGTAPYRWQIVSGELPTGLRLERTTGEIRGKPRRIGEYRLMIQLVDASGMIYQKAFTLSIARRGASP